MTSEHEERDKRRFDEINKKLELIFKKSYFLWALLLFAFMADQIPVLVDFYMKQDGMGYLEFYVVRSFYEQNSLMLFGKIVVFLALIIMFGLFHYVPISIGIVSGISFLLAVISCIKFEHRMEVLRFSDLLLGVSGKLGIEYIHLRIGIPLFLFILLVVVGIIIGFYIERKCRAESLKFSIKLKWIIFSLVAALGILAMASYVSTFTKKQRNIQSLMVSNLESVDKYVIYRFLERDGVGYGDEAIAENLSSILSMAEDSQLLYSSELTNEQYPHVIILMCEAWWNTDNLGERIQASHDPMEPYKELQEKSVSGFVSTNVYGGGTDESEREILMGLNPAFFRTIYKDMERQNTYPSIVDYFNSLGYFTEAMHPYYGQFYHRESAWKNLGFDRILFKDEIPRESCFDRFISDDSFVNSIISEYESQKEQGPFFCYALTLANHDWWLDYDLKVNKEYNYPIVVTDSLTGEKGDKTLMHYANGIYLTNLAIKKLITYFEKQDEPVVLLAFGDHSPNLLDEKEQTGIDRNSSSIDMLMRSYTTPMLLWKNYDGGQSVEGPKGENICYLDSLLLRYAGLPPTDMTLAFDLFASKMKAYTSFYALDDDGERVVNLTKDQISMLNKMGSIMYGISEGSPAISKIWKPHLND